MSRDDASAELLSFLTARLFDARTGAQLGSVRLTHFPWAGFGPDGSVLIATGVGQLYKWD